MPGGNYFREMAKIMAAKGYRSTALAPLMLLSGMSFLTIGWVGTSSVASGWLVAFLCLVLLVLVVACLYWFKDMRRSEPDLLRSEAFALRKLELNRGDTSVGITKVDAKQLPGPDDVDGPVSLEAD